MAVNEEVETDNPLRFSASYRKIQMKLIAKIKTKRIMSHKLKNIIESAKLVIRKNAFEQMNATSIMLSEFCNFPAKSKTPFTITQQLMHKLNIPGSGPRSIMFPSKSRNSTWLSHGVTSLFLPQNTSKSVT